MKKQTIWQNRTIFPGMDCWDGLLPLNCQCTFDFLSPTTFSCLTLTEVTHLHLGHCLCGHLRIHPGLMSYFPNCSLHRWWVGLQNSHTIFKQSHCHMQLTFNKSLFTLNKLKNSFPKYLKCPISYFSNSPIYLKLFLLCF